MYFVIVQTDSDLTHHGIKGQKWGVRRYQNSDGSLTQAGKKKYRSQLAAKDAEISRINRQKASQEKYLKDLETMKTYGGFRKATIEAEFGDDAKDDETLKNTLKTFEVDSVDDFFKSYYGMDLKKRIQ